MADVARKAGVSISTVSHVINGTRFVADATRDRVLQAIRQTGYSHNTLARSLATASTNSIGIAISAISNFYFANIVTQIETNLREAGYTLLLTETHEDPDLELEVVQALHQRRVDGLLLAPTTDQDNRALSYLQDLDVPTVLVDRFSPDDFDQVGTENIEATAHLVEHISGHGHKAIGMISGVPGVRTTEERLQGYYQGLERSGIPADPELVAIGYSNAEGAERAVRDLLTRKNSPTALVVGNNHMTIGTFRALRSLGVEVPRDLAVVCYDDFEWADLFHPRLTTMAQPIPGIANECVRLLLTRIRDQNKPTRRICLPPEFMLRESCGCTSN
ncbi:LacI family DNA-binding transcriptional regulator [Actinomadura graeca]|nr:LacI family DNA-binding transcriptional regulator [Actinomadura graeca]